MNQNKVGLVLASGQSVLGWCCSRWLGSGGQRWEVYMASKASSGLSGFLRVGVSCAVPGSPLGGVGKLGIISAALALSSRNLSNSESKGSNEEKKEEESEVRRRFGQKGAGKFNKMEIIVALPSLVTPSSPSSPFCWKTKATKSHLGVYAAKLDPLQTTASQVHFWSCACAPKLLNHTHKHHTHSPVRFYYTTRSHFPIITTPPKIV